MPRGSSGRTSDDGRWDVQSRSGAHDTAGEERQREYAHTVYNIEGVVADDPASMVRSRTDIPWETQQELKGVIVLFAITDENC